MLSNVPSGAVGITQCTCAYSGIPKAHGRRLKQYHREANLTDKPLRIGILTHLKHPVRQPFAGGLEAFTYDVTLALRKRGHEVTLFASSDSAPELEAIAILDDESYGDDGNRGPKEAFFEEYLNEHKAYMDCMQRIDSHGFDVIFNNALHYVPLMMAALIKTPMLTVLHTPPFFEMQNAIKAAAAHGNRNRFCTVSDANAGSWRPWVPHCDVIPNGIDLNLWHAISHRFGDDDSAFALRHRAGNVQGSVKVSAAAGVQAISKNLPTEDSAGRTAIWFGRLVRDKGPHLAMDAARLAGLSIELAGQASDSAYFAQEIAPRLSDTAVYLGHLDRDALVARVQAASVALVTPCWDEPFGLVVAEALACGTPVAAFGRGAIPQLLTPRTGVVAPPGDVHALAAAALAALTLDRNACRAAAVQLWSLDAMVHQYEILLRQLVARSVPENA